MTRKVSARAVAVVTALTVAMGIISGLPSVSAAGKGPKKNFENVSLPFSTTFRVPRGVSLVRAIATVEGDTPVSVSLFNADTQRPRCYPVVVKTWNSEIENKGVCEALTALDRPGTLWRMDVDSSASTGSIRLQFVKGPERGFAGRLNLDKLSMPQHKMGPTKDFMLESFDGTNLHAELTRPKTSKKVPTIIISSPYFAGAGPYSPDLVNDWGPRGYAILNVDVRGYNESEGCVEVWSKNEQRDQKAIVDWVAKQKWSDGHVGFMGKSYVGTTPIEAATMAPKNLDAIIAVAPVVNTYEDWHFGGVPNGEQTASPLSYQAVYGASPAGAAPQDRVVNAGNGFCDPALAARASDPRGIYDSFYKERDFAAKADKVKAAVMYTHGYEDANVKIAVADKFFNDLDVPHLGLFGHWDHIWPPRPDAEVLFLAWVDQYVKGKNLGLAKLPNAIVENNVGRERGLAKWPTPAAKKKDVNIDFEAGKLGGKAKKGSGQLLLDSTGATGPTGASVLRVEQKLTRSFELGGTAKLPLKATLTGAENGHVAAFLFDKKGESEELITYGMFNLAHRNGHDTYEPVTPGETIKAQLPFLTTDHVFKKGHSIVLEIRAAQPTDSAAVSPSEPGILTLETGAKATRLVAPKL